MVSAKAIVLACWLLLYMRRAYDTWGNRSRWQPMGKARVLRKRLLIGALTLVGYSVQGVAEVRNPCGEILKHGVFELVQIDKTVTEQNVVPKIICTAEERAIGEERAYELATIIKLFGFKIGYKKKDVDNWKRQHCESYGGIKAETSERTIQIKASERLIKEYIRCVAKIRNLDEDGVSSTVIVKDKEGTTVAFKIAWLGRENYWRIGSDKEVLDMAGRSVDMVRYLRTDSTRDKVAEAKDVLGVGTASCGEERSLEGEIERAGRRASQIWAWMKKAGVPDNGSSRRFGTLNLGKYDYGICAEGSTFAANMQRPALILLVLDRSADAAKVDYRSAIIAAAKKDPVFPHLDYYTGGPKVEFLQ